MEDTTQQADEPDQYAEICRAMKPGLLISVNNDKSATESPSGELRVESSGDPALLSGNGGLYHLGTNDKEDTALVHLDSGRETYVETIEILGIRGF